MTKRVLVAWSGGLDSTYLIQRYLEMGYGVDAVTCNLANAYETQMKRERAAMKKMMKGYFKGKDVNLIGTSHIRLEGYCFSTLPLAQVPTWLYNLLCYLRENHVEVAVGYVMNDDAVSYLDSIRKVWNSFQELVHGHMTLPPLEFPLVKYKKTMIWNSLETELKKHVTWCENPAKEDKCGRCSSCSKMVGLGLQDPPPPLELSELKTLVAIEEPNFNLLDEETRC